MRQVHLKSSLSMMGPVGAATLERYVHALTPAQVAALADTEAKTNLARFPAGDLRLAGCLAPLIFTGLGKAGWSCFTQLLLQPADGGALIDLGPVHLCGGLQLPEFGLTPEAFSF